MARRRTWIIVLGLGVGACFGSPDTLGLPCIEDAACFDGQVCSVDGICVPPGSAESIAAEGDGDGAGDGDGDDDEGHESEQGSDEQGDGDGDAEGDGDDVVEEEGDGDGDGEDEGDGDADESGDGDGDGDIEPMCGNNMLEPGESCDGNKLNGKTCADFGFGGGMISCSGSCDFNLTACCKSEGQQCGLLQGQCCGGLVCGLLSGKCT